MLLDGLGELPNRLHPVAWLGRYLEWAKRRKRSGPWRDFLWGSVYLLLGAGLTGGAAWFAAALVDLLPRWLELPLLALLLKPLFSFRALLGAGEAVKRALVQDDVDEARRLLAWHLVSRDTRALSRSEIAGATVESLAENFTDSVVAPLFYFVLFGLPGAAFYRFVNTADAVLGYRTADLEYFGKPAARLDDAFNLIPARLASVLLFAVLGLSHHHPLRGLSAALSATLPSPNAGWTMALVAGGLGVKLDKRGVYVLNEAGTSPSPHAIAQTQRLLSGALGLGFLSLIGLVGLAHA